MENTKPLRLKDMRRILVKQDARVTIHFPSSFQDDIVWEVSKSYYNFTKICIDMRILAFCNVEVISPIPDFEESAKIIDQLTNKLGPEFFYRPPTEKEKRFLNFMKQLAEAIQEQENKKRGEQQQQDSSQQEQNAAQQQNNSQQQNSNQEGQNSSNQNTQSNNTTQSNQRGDSNGVGEKPDKASGEMNQAGDDGKGESNAGQGMPKSSTSDGSVCPAQKGESVNDRRKSELPGQSDQVATESNRLERPAEEEKSQTGSGSATTNQQRLAETKELERLMKRLEEDASSDSYNATPPSSTARSQFGGVTHAKRAAELLADYPDSRKASRRIKKHIEKIIKNTDISGDKQSPRLNAGVLVKQGLSNSYNMSKIRREELNLPVTILMCDVSPSCGSVSTETLAACYSISEELDDAYLIIHSNAYLDKENENTVSELLKKKFANRDIGLILSFADHDGEEDFEHLPGMCELFVWLDHGSRGLSEQDHSRYGDFDAPNLRYWRGVNNIKTAEIALRLIAQNPKKSRRK